MARDAEKILRKYVIRYGPKHHVCVRCGARRETEKQALAHFTREEKKAIAALEAVKAWEKGTEG